MHLTWNLYIKNIGNGGIGDGFPSLSRTPPAWQSRPFPAPSRFPAEDYCWWDIQKSSFKPFSFGRDRCKSFPVFFALSLMSFNGVSYNCKTLIIFFDKLDKFLDFFLWSLGTLKVSFKSLLFPAYYKPVQITTIGYSSKIKLETRTNCQPNGSFSENIISDPMELQVL